MDSPVSVHIQLSAALWKIYWTVHGVCGLLILVYPAVLPMKAAALALLAASGFSGYRVIQNQARVTRLQLSGERNFVWLEGQKRPCEIVGNPFVSHFLVIVTFRLKDAGKGRLKDIGRGGKISTILLRDSATDDELRRLRVYLLTGY